MVRAFDFPQIGLGFRGGWEMRPNRLLWGGSGASRSLHVAGRSLHVAGHSLHVAGRSLHVADMLLAQFAEAGRRPLGPELEGLLSEGGDGSQAHYWRGSFLQGERAHRPTICRVSS